QVQEYRFKISNLNTFHRNFLWGGAMSVRKINWVKWETVCKSKNEDGLGVKDIHSFNTALLNRIPTKDALFRMGVSSITGDGLLCSLCNDHYESTHHLFSTCNLTYHVWQLIYKWLDFSIVLPINTHHHFLYHMGLVNDRKCWKFWGVIWLATIWEIWLSRNDLIFNNVSPSPHQILDSARVKYWLWIKGQMGIDSATFFSDWITHPLLCLNIVL
ncbi:hypothetical protein Lal_00026130, partial [Lupinus albus]